MEEALVYGSGGEIYNYSGTGDNTVEYELEFYYDMSRQGYIQS